MSSFQILDNKGVAIPINTLDREVCKIWGQKVHPKYYAVPKTLEECKNDNTVHALQSNWFDTIGWQIAIGKSFQDILKDWEEVFKNLIGHRDENGKEITLEYLYPKRVRLINTWIKKGYQPIQVKN